MIQKLSLNDINPSYFLFPKEERFKSNERVLHLIVENSSHSNPIWSNTKNIQDYLKHVFLHFASTT